VAEKSVVELLVGMQRDQAAILTRIQDDVGDIKGDIGVIKGRLDSLPCESHEAAIQNAIQTATQTAATAASVAASATATAVSTATDVSTATAATLAAATRDALATAIAASSALSTRIEAVDAKVDQIKQTDLPEIRQQVAVLGWFSTVRGKVAMAILVAFLGLVGAVAGSLIRDALHASPPVSLVSPASAAPAALKDTLGAPEPTAAGGMVEQEGGIWDLLD